MIDPADALQRLRDGNQRFVSGEAVRNTTVNRGHQPELANAQTPFAIVLACSDSRVPTEMIFDQGFGDLFVIRVAGNIVAPSQIGSVEFAAKEFGTRLVVVLGHSKCGAIVATLNELANPNGPGSPNLSAIVGRVRPAVEPVLAEHGAHDSDEVIADAVRANVRASVEQLKQGSSIIESLINNGDLQIAGAEYSMQTGSVEFF